jgi:hypothetical protein
MPNPLRTYSAVGCPHGVGRRAVLYSLAILATASALLSTVFAQGAGVPTLRERSSFVARQVFAAVGHRMVDPVRLEVLNDSTDAILGGCTEVLTEAGHDVRREPSPAGVGTVWTVRRFTSAEDGHEGLDVRVEQWPERSVIYSRLWLAGEGLAGEDADGLIERVVVPLAVGAAAALIVYLFFTVRS